VRVHFDGDLLVYRAGFAAEKAHYDVSYEDDDGEDVVKEIQYKRDAEAWMEENAHLGPFTIEQKREPEPVANALYNVKSLIGTALDRLGVGRRSLTVYLSGPSNFREQIATILPYKGNRDPAHKPVHGPAIKEYIRDRYPTVTSEGEEADDVVGYSHYRDWVRDPEGTIIVSVDKDLDMIPGYHYDFTKDKAYHVDEDQAAWYFWRQLLTGDSTDNIPGIKGLGNKRAEMFLETAGEDPWPAIAERYKEQYGKDWYDALVEVGRLLWIRRRPNQWWLPPKRIRPS
jgi:hypothetical protein